MPYTVLNATPHPVALLADMFSDDDVTVIDPSVVGGDAPALTNVPDSLRARYGESIYLIPASGFRFAADPHILEPRPGVSVGVTVTYTLSPDARIEIGRVQDLFAAYGGSDMIVVASQISVMALLRPDGSTLLNDGSGLLDIRPMWPIIDPRALTLPPPQRWASALAIPRVATY